MFWLHRQRRRTAMNDPTLEEIWQARQKIWNECNQDLHQLLAYYQKRQDAHPDRMIYREEIEEQEQILNTKMPVNF